MFFCLFSPLSSSSSFSSWSSLPSQSSQLQQGRPIRPNKSISTSYNPSKASLLLLYNHCHRRHASKIRQSIAICFLHVLSRERKRIAVDWLILLPKLWYKSFVSSPFPFLLASYIVIPCVSNSKIYFKFLVELKCIGCCLRSPAFWSILIRKLQILTRENNCHVLPSLLFL